MGYTQLRQPKAQQSHQIVNKKAQQAAKSWRRALSSFLPLPENSYP
jgi:hypothetical protein